jgi:hypothetical protein
MSLHLLPMYVSTILYEKYKGLLKEANFQKGCINFKNKDEIQLKIVENLITDCSKIDLRTIRKIFSNLNRKNIAGSILMNIFS